jgi:replicative DNA helicase
LKTTTRKFKTDVVAQNLTAERSALSILCNNQNLVSEITWNPDLFFHPGHRIIFEAIQSASDASEAGDMVAIISRMEGGGRLAEVGGMATVCEILTSIPSGGVELARYYRKQLQESLTTRETVKIVNDNLHDLQSGIMPPVEFAEKVFSVADQHEEAIIKPVGEQCLDLLDHLEKSIPDTCHPMGIDGLDSMLSGGYKSEELVVVAAQTGGGKSILISQSLLACAMKEKPVVLFSLEMSATDIIRRMASNLCGMEVVPINQRPSKHQIAAFSSAIARISKLPITIIDSMVGLREIEAEATRLHRLGKADIIAVDYLQLVDHSDSDSREQNVSEIARRLKNLAGRTKASVVTASQLNEEGRLRESRAIGHHADIVLFIGDDNIEITKFRRGAPGRGVSVELRGELARFEEK